EEGIAFSKGGLSTAEEPPISIHDPTGILLAWIDVGAPSAERLHKASKAARRVVIYTHVEPTLLKKEAASRSIHKVEAIEVFRFSPQFLDELESKIDRNTKLELVRTDGALYVTVDGKQTEGTVETLSLV